MYGFFNGCMVFMKQKDRVILQRETLHKEVWQMPIMHLAQKYGMSDVGLAKICRKMEIPLPPRGHWQKQAHGHSVRKRLLKPIEETVAAEVVIDKTADELFRIARKRKATSEQRHKERQRIFRLQKELKEWEMCNRIRDYLAAMRSGEANLSHNQSEFFAWADTYANHLDPTNEFRIEVLDDA